MVNPGELVILGTSAPLALKVLGPTADYVGNELQGWTQRRVENVRNIFEKAEERLGERLDEPGSVPPRVLKEILEGGSYWDDELGAEYFGGLLASSRSEMPLDDRAAAVSALVGRLSTFQLRAHYVLYINARKLLVGSEIELAKAAEVKARAQIFIPTEALLAGMGLTDESLHLDWNSILQHALTGLTREELMHEDFVLGDQAYLEKREKRVFPDSGLVYMPSLLGIELFCMAHGLANHTESFLDPKANFEMNTEFPLAEGALFWNALPEVDPPAGLVAAKLQPPN